MKLFFSEQLSCKNCHGGINFSTPSIMNDTGEPMFYFNTGLYNLDGKGSYPLYDQGLAGLSGAARDMGKYKVPTLRNLAFTSPFFHDGSANTIEEVIDHYEKGGRITMNGEQAGDGRKNPFKDSLIRELSLNPMEKRDLAAFLLSLSDSSIRHNPLYANPFQYDETRLQDHGH